MGRAAGLHLPRPLPCRPSPLFLGRRPAPLCRSRKFEFLDLLNRSTCSISRPQPWQSLTEAHSIYSVQTLVWMVRLFIACVFTSLYRCQHPSLSTNDKLTIQLPPGLTPWSVLVGESRCNNPISGALTGKIPTNASFPSTHDWMVMILILMSTTTTSTALFGKVL